jgi:hypothetical protein
MAQTRAARAANQAIPAPQKVSLSLTVNGVVRQLTVAPWTTLLDALRDHLDLTGTKKGCDHGQCGACTVLVNGRRINSCLILAIMKDGAEVTTIEGLATNGAAPSGPGEPENVPQRFHPALFTISRCRRDDDRHENYPLTRQAHQLTLCGSVRQPFGGAPIKVGGHLHHGVSTERMTDEDDRIFLTGLVV